MLQGAPLACSREFSSSLLKRSVLLTTGQSRLRVDPDGTVASLHSARVGKLVFGREAVEPFKIQAGVTISLRPREMKVTLAPSSVAFSSAGAEPLQISHSVRLLGDETVGYLRHVRYSNASDARLRIRVISLHDPTTLNFRTDRDAPGEIGVNAFNRGDHIVTDDIGDSTGVRVIGFSPRPGNIYLTRSKQKALELLAAGELPESTAGMSGSILILSQHDVDISPGGTFEVAVASIYHEASLETALSDFNDAISGRIKSGSEADGSVFRCSSPSVNFAYPWARAALESVETQAYSLDRIAAGFGVGVLRPTLFEKMFDASKVSQRKDGFLPHSSAERGGPMETAVFLINACRYLSLKGDKKLARKWYPALRRAGNALRETSSDGLIVTPSASADGWRRLLSAGFPTGSVAEVNLAAACALREISALARYLNKTAESAGFMDASTRIRKSVDGKLRDLESGNLALNLDPKRRLHMEATVDQAVALCYLALDTRLASSTVHRLMEKDFETGYGPRTVPRSNALYYSPDYGAGQLGGCWTRGSLAHAGLAFAAGHPEIGGAQVEKVAALVQADWEKMGGVPGEFPYWFDPDRMRIESIGSDPVAASRFLEALLVGELGLEVSPGGPRAHLPNRSRLAWFSLRGFGFGAGSLFVGRSESRTFVASSLERCEVEGSTVFQGSEAIEAPAPLECVLFWDRSRLVACVGNATGPTAREPLEIPVSGRPLATSLFADLEEFDPVSWQWTSLGRRKLVEKISLRTDLAAGSWKAYRVSPIFSGS